MLQKVRFRCGHVQTMDLTGQASERTQKAEWYAKHVICPDCRMNAASPDEYEKTIRQEYVFPIGMFSVHIPD